MWKFIQNVDKVYQRTTKNYVYKICLHTKIAIKLFELKDLKETFC